MIIQSVDVIVASPGRNFVTLKIQTDDGLVGWGDATVNGRELSVVSYLRDHVAPLLLGGDAHRIEDTWQYLYRGAYWRRGPITMAAIAAVDMALWDLKAKAAGMPLYQLLGGRSRDRIRGYGHATGRDISELLDSVRALVDEGYSAVRVQCGIPGQSTVYGIVDPNSTEPYEPARKSERPVEEEWDTPAYLRHIPRVFEAVRAEFGEELDLLHDAHHRLTPLEAARLGKSLEEYSPFWLEDVTPAENQEGLRLVRQHTTSPLAIGEVFNSVFDYQTLLSEQLIDYVRSSVTHAGGITAVRRLVDLAALSQVKSAFHGPTDISPIGMAAALHLDLAIHNFGLQEHMPHSETSYEAFPRDYRFEDGHYTLGDSPGLGVSLDESFAAKFEYQRAYLPVNRLKDGTIHDW